MDSKIVLHYRNLIKLINYDGVYDEEMMYYLRLYVSHAIEKKPFESKGEQGNYSEIVSILAKEPEIAEVP